MTRAFAAPRLAAALCFLVGAPAVAAPPEPAGYRLDDYRAPTPATLKGAKVIDAQAAHALWEKNEAIFIDVLPHPPKPKGLPKNTVWREPPRSDIPGSVWLPDTGYGELAASTQAYFEQGLARVAAGDRAKPLVFYCLADCWMSWNAGKRALALGYANVYWLPQGTDGWERAGYPLELRRPEPRLE
jgi:PQQ-dependent catabolism-associated CXXCW motif protein